MEQQEETFKEPIIEDLRRELWWAGTSIQNGQIIQAQELKGKVF